MTDTYEDEGCVAFEQADVLKLHGSMCVWDDKETDRQMGLSVHGERRKLA